MSAAGTPLASLPIDRAALDSNDLEVELADVVVGIPIGTVNAYDSQLEVAVLAMASEALRRELGLLRWIALVSVCVDGAVRFVSIDVDAYRTPADLANICELALNEPAETQLLTGAELRGYSPMVVVLDNSRDAGSFQWLAIRLNVEKAKSPARVLRLSYDPRLYERGTVARFAERVVDLLGEASKDSSKRLKSLLSPPADKVNASEERFLNRLEPDSVPEAFADVVRAQPTACAIVTPTSQISYRELHELSDRWAEWISETVGLGARVALLCEHHVSLIARIIGVLKTGGAYVPLDPRNPDGWNSRVLASARPECLISDADLSSRAEELAVGQHIVTLSNLDLHQGPRGPSAESDRDWQVDPDALAYLLHTSGTTGQPKAVAQSNRRVVGHAKTYPRSLDLKSTDRLVLLARYTTDASVMDLFGALLCGASLAVMDPYETSNGLTQTLRDLGPTILHCTPTLFRHIVRQCRDDGTNLEDVCDIRHVVFGGEGVTGGEVQSFHEQFPSSGTALTNGYGPTECTIATQYHVKRADANRPAVPIGKPVDGIDVRLIDEDGDLVDICGEIVIAGHKVAVGYWGLEELTGSRFGIDENGTPFYRSGDWARIDADGQLVHLGRRDDQLKVHGNRVEPREPEALLRMHPMVNDAAVVVSNAGGALVAFVTSATYSSAADARDLNEYLKRQLPAYSVPKSIVVLDEMPIGATGKIDRLTLSDLPLRTERDSTRMSPMARQIEHLFRRVLQLHSFPNHQDFVLAGGDSLQVVQVLALLEEELGCAIPIVKFLERPSIGAVEEFVLGDRHDGENLVDGDFG